MTSGSWSDGSDYEDVGSDTSSVLSAPKTYSGDSGPKYWSEEKQAVVDGVMIRKDPYPISSICGEYHWVWSDDTQEATLLKPNEGDEWGCITLRLKKGKRAYKPKNIEGKFQMCMLNGTFDSMRESREGDVIGHRWGNGAAPRGGKPKKIANSWMVDVEGFDPYSEEDKHIMAVSEVVDDRGYPFLVYTVPVGEGCHPDPGSELIAKRTIGLKKPKVKARLSRDDPRATEEEGWAEAEEAEDIRRCPVEWEPLTRNEQKRLGIRLSERRVALAAHADEDDSGEEEVELKQEVQVGYEVKPAFATVKRKASQVLDGATQSKMPKVEERVVAKEQLAI